MFKGLGNLDNLPGLIKQAAGDGEQDAAAHRRAEDEAGHRLGLAAGWWRSTPTGWSERRRRADRSVAHREARSRTARRLAAGGDQCSCSLKAKELHAEQMQSLAGGMNIPGLSDALGGLGNMQPPE